MLLWLLVHVVVLRCYGSFRLSCEENQRRKIKRLQFKNQLRK